MKKSTLLSVCLVAVLFLTMIACGLTPASKGPATEAPQAQTATSTPVPSPTPRPTATPAAPTSTPTPRPTATPTPEPEPTSTPTPVPPTDTPEPQAAPELGEGLICSEVFSEDFTHPSRDWPTGSDMESRRGPTNGEYQILVRQKNYFSSWSNGLRAADFVLEMDAHYASKNYGAYGLIFGLDSLDNGQDFYTFVVDAEGHFALFSHSGDKWTTLVDWTASPAPNAGQEVNRLRVERRDDAISLAANDQPLITTHDDTFTGPGYIALVAEAFDVGDVDARFDNILACLSPKAWPAATPTPAACPNGSPYNTWTLKVINQSNQDESFTVDGKNYTVPAGGTTEVYLSLGVAHPVTVGGNTVNYSNDEPCGQNTLKIGASAPPPTATPAPAAPSGFDIPAGKALFVFYNYTNIDWNIDIGPYFLAVPANKPGQEYTVATIAIDPGTYTWQASSPGGQYYIKARDSSDKSFEFTVAAGEIYEKGVR